MEDSGRSNMSVGSSSMLFFGVGLRFLGRVLGPVFPWLLYPSSLTSEESSRQAVCSSRKPGLHFMGLYLPDPVREKAAVGSLLAGDWDLWRREERPSRESRLIPRPLALDRRRGDGEEGT